MTLAERIEKFNSLVGDIVPQYVKKDLLDKGFFAAPASTKYHGNYEDGLFDHSCAVMKTLVDLTEKNGLKWEDPGSPYIVGMFHDLCKIDQYRGSRCKDGVLYSRIVEWEYNPDTLLKGHGDKSVMLLSQYFQLTEEEIMCIRYHMGGLFVTRPSGVITPAQFIPIRMYCGHTTLT